MLATRRPTPAIVTAIAFALAACTTPQQGAAILPPPAVTQLAAPGISVRFNELEAPTLATNEDVPATALTITPEGDEDTPAPAALATPVSVSNEPTATLSTEIISGYDVRPAPDELAALAQQVFGASLPGQIAIPAIGVNTTVTPVGWRDTGSGIEWDSPQYAAGFLVSSVAPGTLGNTVIYGHNNIYGEVFRDLAALQPGDGIFITTADGQSFVYSVEIVETFQEQGITTAQQQAHLAYFNPTDDQRLTLLTCWPYTGNSHRIAVVARPSR